MDQEEFHKKIADIDIFCFTLVDSFFDKSWPNPEVVFTKEKDVFVYRFDEGEKRLQRVRDLYPRDNRKLESTRLSEAYKELGWKVFSTDPIDIYDGRLFVSFFVPSTASVPLRNFILKSEFMVAVTSVFEKICLQPIGSTRDTWLSFIDQRSTRIMIVDLFIWSHFHGMDEKKTTVGYCELLEAMSGTEYERQEPNAILQLGGGVAGRAIVLLSPIEISQVRMVRKLMQICRGDRTLVIDGQKVVAISSLDESVQGTLFVGFDGRNRWKIGELVEGSIRWFILTDYFGPRMIDEANRATAIMEKISATEDAGKIDLVAVRVAVEALSNCRHGGILIIDEEAAAETNRLRMQALRVNPFTVSNSVDSGIFDIDGAVFLNRKGECVAFGVILDGVAKPTIGDRSRGSRYNSVVKYIDQRKGLAVGIIVSEDGMFDVIA